MDLLRQIAPELAAVVDDGGRNWRGILIAFVVIVFLCFLIACSIFLFSPELHLLGHEKIKLDLITLEEVMDGSFVPKRFEGTFVNDSTLLYKDDFGNLMLGQITDQGLDAQLLVRNETFETHFIQKYYLSPDQKYLLIAQDLEFVFRYTFKAKYKIFNIKQETVFPLCPPGYEKSECEKLKLEHASWSPTTSSIVFVFGGNLYFKGSIQEKSHQLTHSDHQLFSNGVPDWLYEEEILMSEKAIWWSKNGDSFVFVRFNDTEVPIISFAVYGEESTEHLYPNHVHLRYPKVGQPNPQVQLFVVKIKQSSGSWIAEEPTELSLPPELPEQRYFTSLLWLDENSLLALFMNRVQNTSLISKCDFIRSLWSCTIHSTLHPARPGLGWMDATNPLVDPERHAYYIQQWSTQNSEKGAFKHVAKINLSNGNKIQFLTSGLFEVVKLLKLDTIHNVLYYKANLPDRPGDRHIYRLTLDDNQQFCLTCDLNPQCQYNSATFSPQASYFIVSCDGPGVPFTQLRHALSNKLVLTLQKNEKLQEKIAKKILPNIMTLTVPIQGGFNASVKLILPHNVDLTLEAKYPMLIFVYAGPGSQNVNSCFSIGWSHYMATNKQVIYAVIDGRGSGYKGDRMLYELYKKLGTVEINDQLYVGEYLAKQFRFIDRSRIAIWGWSYGGYASAMALTKDNSNLLKCAIAVAPVTNWLYYDSAYTERFMGLPREETNMANYEKANLLSRVFKIKSNKLLLVHGSADDNVHLQHSMMLIKALNRFNVMYRLQIYPDEDHSLPTVSKHLYSTLNTYLSECLELDNPYNDTVGLRRRRPARIFN